MIFHHTIFLAAAPLAAAVLSTPQSCPIDIPISCHNETAVRNTCCFISAGHLLMTQFWDSDPTAGPPNSWTIHGLWPNNCPGCQGCPKYPQKCDRSREYPNITNILIEGGAQTTLDYMKDFWKSNTGNDESFWKHEWDKHGTCISTLRPHCYQNYRATEDAVDYFKRAVSKFQELPTYEWLANEEILPSRSKKYLRRDIQWTLQKYHGAPVTLRCKKGRLREVWYHFNVQGSLQSGTFVPASPDGDANSCPAKIWYEPKESSRGKIEGLDQDDL